MMYARTKSDAEKYIAENYRGLKIESTGVECQCGETECITVYDDNNDIIEQITICNSCWFDNSYSERIPSEGMIEEKELLGLIQEFEDNICDLKIIQVWDINDDTDFILARVEIEREYLDYEEKTIPFIHYRGKNWVLSPEDWESIMPESPDEIMNTTWRRNGNTDTKIKIIDGLPKVIN